MNFLKLLLSSILLLIVLTPSLAATQDLNPETAQELLLINHAVSVTNELATQGIIDTSQKDAGVEFYLGKAEKLTGQNMSVGELESIQSELAAAEESTEKSTGFFTAVNTLWFIGILFGTSCLLYLAWHYIGILIEILKNIPRVFWEGSFYLAAITIIAFGVRQPSSVASYIGLTGTLIFTGAIGWSSGNERFGKKPSTYLWLVTAIWIFSSLLYGSEMIGWFAIESLMATLGFSVVVLPGVVVLGFEEEDVIPRATMAAFAILIVFLAIHLNFLPVNEYLGIFKPGAFWSGTFVTALGLLIMANRWYTESFAKYILLCGLTLTFGVAAIFLGSMLGLENLSKVGYWLIVIFFMIKYWEIPAGSLVGYSILGLFFSSVVGGTAWFLNLHPEILKYFLF